MNIIVKELDNGAEAVWAVPLSGYGHVADEQPLPYIHYHGKELTPRFGGEESRYESSIASLPLPYGKLGDNWPIKQRLFNMSRKRMNIYWRNLFNSFCNREGNFYLLEQLLFRPIENGFIGKSPLFTFKREFLIEDTIAVNDTLIAHADINFAHFHFAPYAQIPDSLCLIKTNHSTNFEKVIASSTGSAVWRSDMQKNVKFKSGDVLTWQYLYQIKL